jgi:hypothetical protein
LKGLYDEYQLQSEEIVGRKSRSYEMNKTRKKQTVICSKSRKEDDYSN